jgi:hypothetical protein
MSARKSAWGVALTSLALVALLASSASAQFTRRRVPQGEVTGLEMGIQGTLHAVPGERLRWELTLFEVVRRTDLRPSPGSLVRATSSAAPDTVLAEVTTDSAGRASLDLPVGEELESGPHLMLEAISPRGIRRVFEVDLELEPRYVVELFVDRDEAPLRGTVRVFGRVLDRARARAVPERELVVRTTSPLGAPIEVRTDAAGVFQATLPLPAVHSDVQIGASGPGLRGATAVVRVRGHVAQALVVAAEPRDAVLSPGASTTVDVLVRTPDGAPVAGAELDWEEQRNLPQEERATARTDAEGRASLPFPMPRRIDAAHLDHAWHVRAVHPGLGTERTSVSVRVARQTVFASWAVEGGALVPELEGRILVRLAGADGAPLADRTVTLEAPRLGGTLSARTDRDGVALLRGTVGPVTADEGCGGPTAAEARLSVDGHRETFCLPVDPDATLAVRTSAIDGGLRVELARRASVARMPVVVTALVQRGEHWAPLAQVAAGPGVARVELPLPETARAELWVRARPVVDGREVRGGGTLAWVGPTPGGLRLAADAEGARLDGVRPDDTLAVLALEPARADALRAALHGGLGPVGAALDDGAGEGLAGFLLASRTPRDEAVSAVLRDGELWTLPLPSQPVREGLLRDPWRTRARFVRGRIGRLMRAVEQYVAVRVPGEGDAIDDVAVRENGRLRFNEDVLEGVLTEAGLGGEGATSLDGEPLDIAGLRTMDPAFTYDNVARRITRERLWRLLRMLRQLVHHHELDPRWARQGDPTQYLLAMLESEEVPWEDVAPSRDLLVDAWGTPFALRPVRGRARFTFLEPVPGYELVSAGPDGRLGTGDDLADPFARVLPSGSLYAEAVGEDALLAQLQGVALGRATVESLASLFGIDAPETGGDEEVLVSPTPTLPSRFERTAIGPVPVPAPLAVPGDVGSAASRTWTLPSERRRYTAVALRFAPSGPPSSATASLVAGAPYTVSVELPSVMRPGEDLSVPLSIVRLAPAADPIVTVRSGSPALSADVAGARIHLRAQQPGLARLELAVSVDGRVVWSHEAPVRVVPPGRLRARHASALVTDGASLSAPTPSRGQAWSARVVVTAPRALHADPRLAALRDAHPSLVGWAQALRGETVDPELVARAVENSVFPSAIEVACGLLLTSHSGEPTRVVGHARSLRGRLDDETLATRAAVLAALAPAAPGVFTDRGDPVAALADDLREDGWRALASTTDEPSVMARTAAALLLVDREDVRGLALLERARDAIVRDPYGRPSLPGQPERAADGWIGTLALAIAARQAGDDALADELARAAAQRLVMAPRAGAEGAFWALAASVYGAFGVDGPSSVRVVVDGREQVLELGEGAAELVLPARATAELRTELPVLARVESRFVSDVETTAGPLRTRIEGDAGRRGDRSAYELVVEGGEVGAPVVELTLPGAAQLDAAALATLRRASAVRSADSPDAAGVLRLHLEPLPAGGTHRVPLPWRWIAAGRTVGLGITSYDASEPSRATVSADRDLTVEESR